MLKGFICFIHFFGGAGSLPSTNVFSPSPSGSEPKLCMKSLGQPDTGWIRPQYLCLFINDNMEPFLQPGCIILHMKFNQPGFW